jgi:hypothetical protein
MPSLMRLEAAARDSIDCFKLQRSSPPATPAGRILARRKACEFSPAPRPTDTATNANCPA